MTSDGADSELLSAHPRSVCFGRLSYRGLILLSLLALATAIISVVSTLTLGKFFAARGIQQAAVSFQMIDVGAIDGSDLIHPRIVGRVARPSPFNAVFFPMNASIKVAFGNQLLRLGTVSLPALSVKGGEDLALNFTAAFRVENATAFGLAGKQFVGSNASSWVIESHSSVKCWIFGIFPLYLSGVKFSKAVDLQGMSGFSQALNPITMNGVTKAAGSPGSLAVSVSVNLFNPSYIAARIVSEIHMNVSQRGKHFGVATLSNFDIRPGMDTLSIDFVLENTEVNRDAVRAFILGYIRADELEPVTMHGSPLSTQDPYLREVLNGFDLTFNFKPPGTQFIHALKATIGFTGLRATASIFNPLPQTIVMGNMDLSVKENDVLGEDIFRLNTSKSKTHIPGQILQANQTTTLNISLSLFDAHLTDISLLQRLIADARQGKVVVGVKGPVTITISPSFEVTVDYSADHLVAELECPVFCGPGAHENVVL